MSLRPTVRRRSATRALAALVTTLAVLAPTAPASAQPRHELTVMTRNLYLGADVSTLFGATDLSDLLQRSTALWQGVQATRFAERAEALADEVAAHQPDVLGLSEVSLYRTDPANDGPATPATHVELDFLATLHEALAARGLHYRTASLAEEFDGEQPTLLGFDVRLTDRDAILTRTDVPGLRVDNARQGHFDAALTVPVLGDTTLDVVRGWTSVDVALRDRTLRVISTHLETEDFPDVQVAQGLELLGLVRRSGVPTVVLGDLNSAADGSTTPTYRLFRLALFADAWRATHPGEAGYTCCQAADLRNPESRLDERIDYVLHRRVGRAVSADVVGEEQADRTPSGLWPSDHAGVVATLRLR